MGTFTVAAVAGSATAAAGHMGGRKRGEMGENAVQEDEGRRGES